MTAAAAAAPLGDQDYGLSEFWTWDEAMWEQLRWLRTNDPVHYSEASGMYIITKFDDLVHVSKNNELFCSGQGVLPHNPAKLSFIDEDEPRHGEMRGLVNKGFTPRMVKRLEAAFEIITAEAINKIGSAGKCDFVDDIAVPLPLLIIAEMIGIRKEDRQTFHAWSDAMILAQGNMDNAETMEAAANAFGAYAVYVQEIINARMKSPKDDLISILVGAKEDGLLGTTERVETAVDEFLRDDETKALNQDELTMFCVLLLVAGNETTRNGLTGGMKLLLEHPDAKERLIADPELIPDAAEELLRLTSPIISFLRTATQDVELRDKTIKKGQQVMLVYPSANRDEEEFEKADSLDIDRKPHHVAFGIGNHFCLGANLARMELRVAYREVLKRLRDIEFDCDGPTMAKSALVRSFQHMPIKYTPEG